MEGSLSEKKSKNLEAWALYGMREKINKKMAIFWGMNSIQSMTIQSSKTEKKDRLVTQKEQETDLRDEFSLRPKFLDEYIGQAAIKKHLRVSIDASKIRSAPLEHILLYGPPWLGKTTLAQILAHEMTSELRSTSGPAIEKQSDIVSLLTSLKEGDILFIDEIHRLRPPIEEILYSAMEDYVIDIMIGSGTGATSVRMPLPKFTLIGATTKLSKLSSPLRDRFGNILKLDFYEINDLKNIILRSFQIFGFSLQEELAQFLAKKSRWTPRIANRYVKILRDYATIGQDIFDIEITRSIFSSLWIDETGLDGLDRKVLSVLAGQFSLRPVGLSTLASIVGEEESTIEDVVEPYLLKIGYIERTPKWRQITSLWEDYLQSSSFL